MLGMYRRFGLVGITWLRTASGAASLIGRRLERQPPFSRSLPLRIRGGRGRHERDRGDGDLQRSSMHAHYGVENALPVCYDRRAPSAGMEAAC